MRWSFLPVYTGPLVILSALVAISCLAGLWYINRLQSELALVIRRDAAAMESAIDLQVYLRNLRVHALVQVVDPNDSRKRILQSDVARVQSTLDEIDRVVTESEDRTLVETILRDYARYQEQLRLDELYTLAKPVSDIAQWSDAHHMEELLAPCRKLAESQRNRMKEHLERSETQSTWAGRILLSLGAVGILSGLLSGYVIARSMTHQETRLLIQVQAVHAHLDQEVGAMTVHSSSPPGNLNEYLERIVDRVSGVCQRLQEQERHLLRAEQLAAVGQLAAGVAHEVRNPLTGVKVLLQAAVRDRDPVPLTMDRVQLLLNEVGRIERTVQGLMDYASPAPLQKEISDIRVLLERTLALAQSRSEEKSIKLELESSQDQNQIFMGLVDTDQFLSLLTNLLFNAIEASPPKGKVVLKLSQSADGKTVIQVIDHGPGIDPRMLGRLFVPFATTKPKGTGLGLTIARKIAREHGGDLTASNLADHGACFVLTLPSLERPHV